MTDGELAFVPTYRDYFSLQKTSTATLVVNSVIATASGTGRWVRMSIPHPTWATQAGWFVDPTSGSDEYDGSAATATGGGSVVGPLKTHAELERRWGPRVKLNQLTTVTLLGNLTSTDPMRVSVFMMRLGTLRYRGTKTQVGSASTFTAVTAIARASNQPQEVVDTAGVMGTNVFKRIRITSGARAGATAWIAKDLGSSRVRTSAFVICADASLPLGTATVVSPIVGDPYVIETLSSVASRALEMGVDNDLFVNSTGVQFSLSDIDFRSTSSGDPCVANAVVNGAFAEFLFIGCDMGFTATQLGIGVAVGCRHSGAIGFDAMLFIVQSGLITQRMQVNVGSNFVFDFDTLAQGVTAFRARMGGSARVGTLCVMDSTSDGLLFEDGFGSRCDGGTSGTLGIYGSGNAGVGIKLEAGMSLAISNLAAVTITGTVGDFKLGGATSVRAYDDSAGTFTAARACTWALLATSVAGGGHGSNACNPINGAQIVLKQ